MARSPMVRAALAFASLSLWLVLLFSGAKVGRATYILPVAAVALFPWPWLRKPVDEEEPDEGADAEE